MNYTFSIINLCFYLSKFVKVLECGFILFIYHKCRFHVNSGKPDQPEPFHVFVGWFKKICLNV